MFVLLIERWKQVIDFSGCCGHIIYLAMMRCDYRMNCIAVNVSWIYLSTRLSFHCQHFATALLEEKLISPLPSVSIFNTLIEGHKSDQEVK
mmetsp:Transcript_47777/g.48193  ORF Transcript_47777/g.48193 Transcript_47777/m.48193 type:complete len:91 (+) Transcript_47777:616-888(+)